MYAQWFVQMAMEIPLQDKKLNKRNKTKRLFCIQQKEKKLQTAADIYGLIYNIGVIDHTNTLIP